MALPPDFQFSQGSLQDYVDCPRRFQLRYLMRLAWPAPVAEPLLDFERQMIDGDAFHRLVHQHLLGLDPRQLTLTIRHSGEGLAQWWENYLAAAPAELPGERYPELSLSTVLGGHRLQVRYDLLVINPGQAATILDWKTARSRPSRAILATRLQTRVYRHVLVQAATQLNRGHPLVPAQVMMVYWFAGYPKQPEHFAYDDVQYTGDALYLARLIDEIAGQADGDLPAAEDDRHCLYCVYRSLCERGVRAGQAAGLEDDPLEANRPAAGFDFEQIGEIAF